MGLLSTEAYVCGNGTGNNTPLSSGSGHHEEDLGNGTWAAIGVVLSIRTFGLNLYNFIKNKNRSKDGQQALPDADSLD